MIEVLLMTNSETPSTSDSVEKKSQRPLRLRGESKKRKLFSVTSVVNKPLESYSFHIVAKKILGALSFFLRVLCS